VTERREDFSDSAALVEAWADRAGEPLRPEQELRAEHLLMRSVVAAMRAEGEALLDRNPLRPHFWNGVVDFIGNFVHFAHRAKEEATFFPMLIRCGLIDSHGEAHLHREHGELKELTLELCDGVGAGDWEKALRVVARYVDLVSAHLDAEERHLNSPAVLELPTHEIQDARRAFDEIEATALTDTARSHYLDLTKSLCRDVGIEPVFVRNDR